MTTKIKIGNAEIKSEVAYPYLAGMCFATLQSLNSKAKSLKALMADENVQEDTKRYMTERLVNQIIEDFTENEQAFEAVRNHISERVKNLLAEIKDSNSN